MHQRVVKHACCVGRILICLLFFAVLRNVAAAEQQIAPVGKKLEQLKDLIHKDKTEDLSVPPVYARPLGADAGPRVHVTRFIVDGVIEHPEQGITLEAVNDLAERARLELQNIDILNQYGLTQQDLELIGKRLKNNLYKDSEALKKTYGEVLEQVRRDKKYREEMSIGQLQEVANRLTDFYRAAGFIIAQVYVPEQNVTGGIVRLQVAEGTLGNVKVEDNQSYSAEVLSQRFESLKGETVQKSSMETALLSLSDYPGLIAYGVLQPGERTGESDLVIKVQEEQNYGYALRLENYGSELTGEYRLTGTFYMYNPLGNADDLQVNLLAAFSPANTLYGDVSYRYPIIGTDVLLGGGLSSNTFDIGGSLASSNVGGTVNGLNVFSSYQFKRSRTTNSFGKLELSRKNASADLIGVTITEDILTALSLHYGFDDLDIENRAINKGTIKLTNGFEDFLGSSTAAESAILSSRTGGSGAKGGSDFMKLNWDLARLQLIDKYQNILFRFSGQWSNDLLVSVEQAGMGGPANVRAFTVSEYLRDSAAFVSVDWNFNAPGFYDVSAFDNWKWGEILQFSVFADYAYGVQNDPGANDLEKINLAGAGVAAQLLLPGQMQLRLDIGYPLNDPLDKTDIQLYFTFSYSG